MDNRTLQEQIDGSDGRECRCMAHSSGECGCDVDWTPAEVYRLRGLISRAIADYIEPAIADEQAKFRGYEHCSDLERMRSDLAEFSGLLRVEPNR